MRYPNIKQTLGHLVSLWNSRERKEISKLQEEIEQASLEVELNRLDDSYLIRLNHLTLLQNRYMGRTGKYHPVGLYKKERRIDDE